MSDINPLQAGGAKPNPIIPQDKKVGGSVEPTKFKGSSEVSDPEKLSDVNASIEKSIETAMILDIDRQMEKERMDFQEKSRERRRDEKN